MVHGSDGLDLARLVVDDYEGAVLRGEQMVCKGIADWLTSHRKLLYSWWEIMERPRPACIQEIHSSAFQGVKARAGASARRVTGHAQDEDEPPGRHQPTAVTTVQGTPYRRPELQLALRQLRS